MLILLSPAKTMVGSSRTTVPFVTVPLYKNEAEHIAMEMAGYSVEEPVSYTHLTLPTN